MDEAGWPVYASALAAGAVFGFVTQRGSFCLTRALSNLVLIGDTAIARAYLLALVVAMIGVHGLQALGQIELPIRPFHWLANVVGGLLFGAGMIVAGGCAASTWYRAGEGAIGAWIILLGFGMGATTASVGALAPARRWLQEPSLTLSADAPTLPALLGVSPWIVILVLAGATLLLFARQPAGGQHGKWRWWVTGLAVGLVIAAGWWASTLGGTPVGLTFASNTGYLLTYPMIGYPNRVSWGMLMLVGVPLGAFAGAWWAREFRWKLPPGWSLLQVFAGGLLMGASAVVAEGCNVTQGLTNSSTLALGSLTAFASMWVGGYAALWTLFRPARS
jgi:hypothetical protein